MPQKRPDYSKFTQPNGTIQVLMFWASLMLHLVIGSNLGLFGRLDPIKVKPAGGTVRVVDLTPTEQTRVPEAAKSRPLPIARNPVNPEPATRTPANSTNTDKFVSTGKSGASNFVPPEVDRPQLPPPSSKIPPVPPQPTVQTKSSDRPQQLLVNPRTKIKGTAQSGDQSSNLQIPLITTPPATPPGTPPATPPGTPPATPPGTPPATPSGTPPATPPGTPSATPPGTPPVTPPTLQQLQNEFAKDIRELKKSAGSDIAVERLPLFAEDYSSSYKDYPSIRNCNREKDGYILIAILLDENGKIAEVKTKVSPFLRAYDDKEALVSKAVFKAGDKAEIAYEKAGIKGQKKIYDFNFRYSAKTC